MGSFPETYNDLLMPRDHSNQSSQGVVASFIRILVSEQLGRVRLNKIPLVLDN